MCCSSSCCLLMLGMVLLLQVELWVWLYFAGSGFILLVSCLFLFFVVGTLCSWVVVSTWVCSLFWGQFSICLLVSPDSSLCLLLMQLVLNFGQLSFIIHKKEKKWQNAFLFLQMILLLSSSWISSISTFTEVGSMLFLGTNIGLFLVFIFHS